MKTSLRSSASSVQSIVLWCAFTGILGAATVACTVEADDADTVTTESDAVMHGARTIRFENHAKGAYTQAMAESDFGQVNWFSGLAAGLVKIHGYGVGYSNGLELTLKRDPINPWGQSYAALIASVPAANKRFLRYDLKIEQDFDFVGDGRGWTETKLGGLTGGNACHACQREIVCRDGGFNARFILSSSADHAYFLPYVYGQFSEPGACGNEDHANKVHVQKGVWYTMRMEVRLGEYRDHPKDHLKMIVKRTSSDRWTTLYDGRRSLRGDHSFGVDKVRLEFARGGSGGLRVNNDSRISIDNIAWGTL